MISWNDAWITGVEIIDTEHRRLISLLSKMEQEVHSSSPYLQAQLRALASEVTNHITSHFAHEEDILSSRLSREDTQLHIRAHRKWRQLILRNLGELNMQLSAKLPEEEVVRLSKHFVVTIYNFFSKHFDTHDCKLCKHCSSLD
jgi:hemerythrin-like metal-binding protein